MYRVVVIFCMLIPVGFCYGQLPADAVQTMIKGKSFTFSASTVQPTAGRTRQLTPGYTLDIKNDSLIADLPYFGRVYNVDYGASSGGYDFISTKFDYRQSANKKGGWTIQLKLKDRSDPNQLTLFISETGHTTVTIISNNRQPISYSGVLVKKQRR